MRSEPGGAGEQDEIETVLREELAEVLERPAAELAEDVAFDSCGLDSIGSLHLCDRIERRCQVRVSEAFTWKYPTLRQLARHVAALRRSAP